MIERRITQWIDRIPGVIMFREGKRTIGLFTLVSFILVIAIAVLNLKRVVLSVYTFVLGLTIAISSGGAALQFLRSEHADWWIATAALLALPVLIWKRYQRIVERRGHSETLDRQVRLAWKKFVAHRQGVQSVWIISLLYGIALLAPYVAPYHPNAQEDIAITQFKPPLSTSLVLTLRNPRYPSLAYFHDSTETRFGVEMENEFLHRSSELLDPESTRLFFVDSVHAAGNWIVAFQRSKATTFAKVDLIQSTDEEWKTTRVHVFGTDRFGRDAFSRMVYGARVSLGLGLIAVLLAVVIGTTLGTVSGYLEGKFDFLLMRFVDMMLAFPTIFIILLIVALFESIPIPRIMLVVLVIGMTSWMTIARLVRGQVLSVKNADYVIAAQSLGFSTRRIIVRHILPNVLTQIIVYATLRLGGIILVEAALSFLNLGVQPPTPSWGNMIFEGKDFLSSAWWMATMPGLAIVGTVVSFNLFGDGLRDALDPRMRAS